MKTLEEQQRRPGQPEVQGAAKRLPYWRVLWFDAKLFLLYLPGVACMLFYMALRRWFPSKAAHYQRKIPAVLSAWILKLNGVSACIKGMENLPTDGRPVVMFSNHNSRFDAYIMLARMPFHYKAFWSNESHVTTEHLFLVEWFGHIFDLFFVHDKKDPRVTAKEFRKAGQFLKQGGRLSFFPEGTATRGNAKPIDPFGNRCARLAIEAGADIVPIVMTNTKYTFERKTRTNIEVQVLIGTPISTAGMARADVEELTGVVHDRMVHMFEDLSAEQTTAKEAGDNA